MGDILWGVIAKSKNMHSEKMHEPKKILKRDSAMKRGSVTTFNDNQERF